MRILTRPLVLWSLGFLYMTCLAVFGFLLDFEALQLLEKRLLNDTPLTELEHCSESLALVVGALSARARQNSHCALAHYDFTSIEMFFAQVLLIAAASSSASSSRVHMHVC